MRIQTHSHKRAKIEIVPLIDVVFFLLATFVMVSLSMTRNQGMQVQLPAASTATKQEQPQDKAVTLTVMQTGEIYYNKEKVSAAQLPFKLQSLKASVEEPRIILNAAADADFKKVVGVLDEARKVGITRIGISTEKR